MTWVFGDIWIYWKLGSAIVIPTNAGWKSDGTNVMGAGLAKQAAAQFSDLTLRYGRNCKEKSPYQYYKDLRLILVPSKLLNEEKPYLSWQGDSDINVVKESLIWLNTNADSFESDKVYVPLLGAGNGHLDDDVIKKIMKEHLKHPKFFGVLWNE
jgi:hypothetical protein